MSCCQRPQVALQLTAWTSLRSGWPAHSAGERPAHSIPNVSHQADSRNVVDGMHTAYQAWVTKLMAAMYWMARHGLQQTDKNSGFEHIQDVLLQSLITAKSKARPA